MNKENPQPASTVINASDVVDSACNKLDYNLSRLIALVSIWVNPEVVQLLAPIDGIWYPKRRRANEGLRVAGKRVERVRDVIDGITLDDNTYANTCFKRALGIQRKQFAGFNICHIWAGTAYDPRYFTQIANLVAIPSELASLTDHHHHVAASLKFRSWELYGWKPDKELAPVRPANYPNEWRDPFPFNKRCRKSVDRKLRKNSVVTSDGGATAAPFIGKNDTFAISLGGNGFQDIARDKKRRFTAQKDGRPYRFSCRKSPYSPVRNAWSFTFSDVADEFSHTTHLVGLMQCQKNSNELRDELFVISPAEIKRQFQSHKTWDHKKQCNRYDVNISNDDDDKWKRWVMKLDKI
jgi:hypothetical protein